MRLACLRLLALIISVSHRSRLSVGVAALTISVAALTLSVPSTAHAQAARAGAPLHVLSLDSEEADEQAEALSVALRVRARQRIGSVAESSPSLSMFTAALKCPSRPDNACLQKISEQLKTDRFIYGHIARAGRGQLSAEIHLWVRGKPDVSVKEIFSDNVKDQNDEYLRRMAGRIVDRLTGASQTAIITVRAGKDDGVVWVDGAEKGRLEKGRATVELSAGRHVVEVRVLGHEPVRKDVTVAAGADAEVVISLDPAEAPAAAEATTPVPAEQSHGGSKTRSIVGWSLVGLGAVAGGFGIYEGVRFFQLKSETNDFRDTHRTAEGSPSKDAICLAGSGQVAPWGAFSAQEAKEICDNYDAAKTASMLGLISGGVALVSLGVGTYLLVTDASSSKKEAPAGQGRLQILPYLGPRASGLDVRVIF